jgi:DNA mismatch repair protein MutS2
VYVLPLKKEGVISKLGATPNDPIEVAVGIIKVRVGILDLRKTRGEDKQAPSPNKTLKTIQQPVTSKPEVPDFVPQTPKNTLDVRGSDADTATEKTLNFIDKCMLAGENFLVIIHGHGSDRLKSSIRQMLRHNCPYNIAFRPGETGEGGDGVTVIAVAKG